MSKNDPPPPGSFEELQERLRKALRESGLHGAIHVVPPGGSGAKATSGNATGDDASPPEPEPVNEERLKRIREFSLRPRDIRDYLDRFVIKQTEAKKVLSVAMCDHYNHVRRCLEDPRRAEVDYAKQNVLLLGPTGVGKTYLMRTIARLIGVPFVKADATKFSETGYVGNDVEDLVRDLVKNAGGDVDLAQYGIVYVDEIDKIAGARDQGGREVSGRGVQINLLKLMEDTEVSLFSPTDMMSQMRAMMGGGGGKQPNRDTINTRHILFIVSGAFDRLAETVKRRVQQASIGFTAPPGGDDDDLSAYLTQAATRDFIDYGFEPEFIGRVPVRVACESLKPNDLAEILTASEGSLLRQYQEDFQGYGITLTITPEAVMEVARRAHGEKTGARGLMTVLERILREYKFELPSTGIHNLEVTTELIAEPEACLKRLLVDNFHLMHSAWERELNEFAEAFERENGISLAFTPEALQVLVEAATERDRTLRSICDERFADFGHGLPIIRRNTGQKAFTIDEAAARNPDDELSRWIVVSFRKTSAEG